MVDIRSLVPFGRNTGLTRVAGDTDPFTSLKREMDRMFEEFARGWDLPAATLPQGVLSPKVNVAETEKGLEMTAELPGVDPDSIDLNLADNVLTLRAEHKQEWEDKDEKRQYHVVERAQGTFMRRFGLPFEADANKVEANYENGVLKVFVPRSETSKQNVRRIEIKKA